MTPPDRPGPPVDDPTEDPTDGGVLDTDVVDAPPAPAEEQAEAQRRPLWRAAVDALKIPVLAVITALIVGAVLLVFTDPDTLDRWQSFFDDPGAAFSESWELVTEVYAALFRGSFGSTYALSETIVATTPLILAGLAVGVAFRAGLFNIGVAGQILVASLAAAYVGFRFELPFPLHVALAILAGVVAGAVWAGIAGVLRARTGAHEVITTIMLNYIALHTVNYLLSTERFLRPGRRDPITPPIHDSAELPRFMGEFDRAHVGIFLAMLVALFVWWLLFRTTVGFRLRSVGANPHAAAYAGMGVGATWVIAMAISGALAGAAGAVQLVGLDRTVTGGLPGLGFTAIALALLGRSHPAGIVAAAFLFGALQAGGTEMSGATGTPLDLVAIIQALIIAFIAAPALIRSLWRVKHADDTSQQLTSGWVS